MFLRESCIFVYQAYMHILQLNRCQLLERLKADHDAYKVHDVDFNNQFWDGVMSRLVC